MRYSQVRDALSALDNVTIQRMSTRAAIYVSELDDACIVDPRKIESIHRVRNPRGGAAYALFCNGNELQPLLIITNNDVVFAPADTTEVLESPIPIRIKNSPPLVAYSEMEFEAAHLKRGDDPANRDANLMPINGSFIQIRCFIEGAMNHGMRPIRTAARWIDAWESWADGLPIACFRNNEAWTRLISPRPRGRSGQREQTEGYVHPATPAIHVDSDSFYTLSATLTITNFDSEFVRLWKKWLAHVPPASLDRALRQGLPNAHSYVYLDSGGRGEIEIEVVANDASKAIDAYASMRFNVVDGEMSLDEVVVARESRGTGIWQQILSNTKETASLLGMVALKAHATGIGSYVLARDGFDLARDPYLHEREDDDL